MNGRERIKLALNHKEADRVPVDFGGCAQTTIQVGVIAKLREYFGLECRPVIVEEPYTMMGRIDEDLKQALGVDVDALNPLFSFFGIRRGGWKEFRMEDGLEVLVPGEFQISRDEQGDIFTYPQGDTSVHPSARMPKGGYYFDAIMRQKPIEEEKLRVEDNLEEFGPIGREELDFLVAGLKEQKKSGRAALGVVPGSGLGDIACVPAPWLKDPKGIRDIEEWYISTIARPELLHEIFDRQTDIALENLAKIHAAIGEGMDVAWVCGTDFGTQTTTFCSPATYDSLYKPYYRKVNDWIHANTSWKTFKHCCGAVESFMEAFIDSGFDVMNPIQWTAEGMDPKILKKRYGDRLVFWGGGVDTQRTLPFGTPGQVREEVLRVCEIFAPGGGFVFNTIHNIQANTPVLNIIAMLEALDEFNGRS
ncbi:MAG: uroporphyrinogen decarboxylase family protein [Rectinemataceae bacterium]